MSLEFLYGIKLSWNTRERRERERAREREKKQKQKDLSLAQNGSSSQKATNWKLNSELAFIKLNAGFRELTDLVCQGSDDNAQVGE